MEQRVTDPKSFKSDTHPSIYRIGIKSLIIFILINLLFALINPTRFIGRISLYNQIIPGRERLPFGEEGEKSFNLSLFNVDAMVESLTLSHKKKKPGEYRVYIMGDSSVWGIRLKPEDTLAGMINESKSKTCDELDIQAYNIGYPSMSLLKDLMFLKLSKQYPPDLFIWLVTLESFPKVRQLESPIVIKNPWLVNRISADHNLSYYIDTNNKPLSQIMERSIIGQRKALSDLIWLQVYGFLWAATGIDQYIPDDYQKAQRDLSDDDGYYNLTPNSFSKDALAFDVLLAGVEMASPKPILVVNEPIMVSSGKNSGIRYNYYYPRWAYDEYRKMIQYTLSNESIPYFDYWDLISEDHFTNTSIHLDPQGTAILSRKILEEVKSISCGK